MAVPEALVELQRLPLQVGADREVTGRVPGAGQVVQGVGLAESVAEAPVDRQCLLVEPGRDGQVPGGVPNLAEVPERSRLAEPVATGPGRGQRGAEEHGGLLPGAFLLQESRQGSGQGRHPRVLAACGVGQRREQVVPLGAHPGQGLGAVGEPGLGGGRGAG